MLNKIIVMGRLTRDPELKQTSNGQSVCNITLAVDRDYKNAEGGHDTDFLEVVVWRASAEFVCKYFHKGTMAIVEGSLQIRPWTDKDGNNRRTAEIVAENIRFGESKAANAEAKNNTPAPNSIPGAAVTSVPAPAANYAMTSGEDDELPF